MIKEITEFETNDKKRFEHIRDAEKYILNKLCTILHNEMLELPGYKTTFGYQASQIIVNQLFKDLDTAKEIIKELHFHIS